MLKVDENHNTISIAIKKREKTLLIAHFT